eukprot:8170359-Pyramimonas_sp.AAC.1
MVLSDTEVYLNEAADFFAGKAADAGQVTEDAAQRTLQADERVFKVLGRLLSVQREVLFCSDREKVRRIGRTRASVRSLDERFCRLRDSGHDCVVRSSSFKCRWRARSFARRGPL